jgi:NAD-dependent deacetylase
MYYVNNMREIVVTTGSGVSAESGLSTFRNPNGLWNKYPIEEVATVEAWGKDPKKVTEFYTLRRQNCNNVFPNKAHKLIAQFEKNYSVKIKTQNIDDLHEKAGSTNVLHLHGISILREALGLKKPIL